MPFNLQFKEIKGQTFNPFEIISFAIKRKAFLYLLIICVFQCVFQFQVKEIIHPTSDAVSLLIELTKVIKCLRYITFLSLWKKNHSMHSEKACLK